MAKELLIYGPIDSYSASLFVEALADISPDEDIVVRVNTNGGSPEYGWGMAAKLAEHKGQKTVKLDGKAHSMGLFFACYADNVEVLDVTEALLHRAAYSTWFESNAEYFTAEIRANLERVNKSLQKAFEAKVDVAAFEALKGVTLKEIFSLDSRKEVFLSATDLKKIGLADKVSKITPAKRAEIQQSMAACAYRPGIEMGIAAEETTATDKSHSQQNSDKMTLEKLKAEHPSVYAEAIAAGVAQEKDRVEACLVFLELDPKAVKEAIESGKPLSAKQMAEFTLKAANPAALKALETENAPAAKTDEPENKETTADEKKVADFEAKVREELGLTSKK